MMIISEKQIMELMDYITKLPIVGCKGISMRNALLLVAKIHQQQSEELKVIE